MTGDCQRSKSTQIPTVGEGNEAERDDDQENRLFVHMPAEEKRRITTKSDGADESVPSWFEEEFDETNLRRVIFRRALSRFATYDLEGQCQYKRRSGSDVGQYSKQRVTNKATSDAIYRSLVDRQAQPRRDYCSQYHTLRPAHSGRTTYRR